MWRPLALSGSGRQPIGTGFLVAPGLLLTNNHVIPDEEAAAGFIAEFDYELDSDDRKLGGIRFVADGGRYTIRTNLLTRGWRGWAVYAGTLRGHEIIQQELDQAEVARERTGLGKDAKRHLESGPKS